jgi:hypothetical protein
MHDIDRGQRVALRAKLLLGVAGAAAAASSTAYADQPVAPPADPQKWAPYSDFGGSVGSGMVGGKLDFFVPVFQNLDSLAFLNLGVGTETKANVLYNIGAGFRTKIDPDWIVGVYAGHDGTQLDDNNTFGQGSFGAELMSADWDVRVNGYLADSAPKQVPGATGLYINGTTIAILDAQDVGYSGFDGEVGYRVFSTDDTDVRVFVGGFHFGHSDSDLSSTGQSFDFSYRDMSGPKARAEATVYDLDIIGNQSRLTVDGQISHDDVRGTTGSVGVTLRIPLGSYSGSSGAQALDELDRRMADPVRHNDQVLTRAQYTKPEPVIIYGAHVTSQPTNTLLYVDGTAAASAGTYAHPTTLPDAVSRHTTNAFIVLDSKAGPIPGGVTLQPGQTLVPGGDTFTVEGEFSHAKFTHLFDPSTTPTLIPGTAGGNVLTLANNTSLYGFNIAGNFGTAIYGKNVDNVNISHVAIDGTGGGQTGINLQHTVSGEEKITIQGVTVSNVAQDGIEIESDIEDGGSSTEAFALSNVSVTNAGGYGIAIGDLARAGSKITDTISLSNVTVGNTGYGGILLFATASGAGSSINQTATLSNVTVTGTGYDGIDINAYAASGATVTSNQTLSNVTVTDAAYTGISVYDTAFGVGSTVSQTFLASNVAVTGGYAGFDIESRSAFGATIDQNITISNLTLSHIGGTFGGVGLELYAGAYNGTVEQYATLSNITASYTTGSLEGRGVEIGARAYYGGHIVQHAALTNVSATHDLIGLDIYASATDYKPTSATTIDQTVTVTGGTFSNDSEYGVRIVARAAYNGYFSGEHGYQSEAAVSQSVTLTNAAMDHDGYGIYIAAEAHNGASVAQDVTLYNVDISHNTDAGLAIDAVADYVGFATQQVSLNNATGSYNEIGYNAGAGLYIGAGASKGGQISQHVYVYSTNINHNTADGVSVENRVNSYYSASGIYHYSHLQQNLVFAYGAVSHNGGDGISISNTVTYGAQIDQFIDLYQEKVNHNGGDGFRETSTATTYGGGGFSLPTNLHSDVYIYSSDLSHNAQNGIDISTTLKSPTYPAFTVGYSYAEQHINIGGTTANYNTGSGLVVAAHDSGVYGDNVQYITLTGSKFTHNGANGASFIATQYYGPGSFGDTIQEITITGSTFNHNTGNGLYAYAYAHGQQGRAEQHFTVTNSHFDYNGANGIYLKRVAENGVYLPGFACTGVQGVGGGCAFVRQTFDMTGGSASYNQVNGLYVRNYATNYGAIYNESGRPTVPTVYLSGAQFNGNGNDGFYERNIAENAGYIFNFVEVLGSTFNDNVRDGFHVNSYASASLIAGLGTAPTVFLYDAQLNGNGRDGFYSQMGSPNHPGAANEAYVHSFIEAIDTTFNYNGRDGFHTYVYANGGAGVVERNLLYSYATGTTANGNGRYGVNIYDNSVGNAAIISFNSTLGLAGAGITASGNGSDGITITASNDFFFPTGIGYVSQYNTLYGNTTSSNGRDGIHLFAGGPGVGTSPNYYQVSKLVGNTSTANTRYGIYGTSIFGSYQVVNVYTGGNTVTSNTAGNYNFTSFIAGQHVY